MYQRKTSHRLYYTSGLISLVLLPFLCWKMVYNKNWTEALYSLEIVMPDPPGRGYNKMFSIVNFPKNYNESLIITGHEASDIATLNHFQTRLRGIIKHNISDYTIHLFFSEKAKYWTMVRAVDICNAEGLDRYAMYGNEFWAVHKPTRQTMSQLKGFGHCVVQITAEPENSFDIRINQVLQEFNFFYKRVQFIWPSIILFCLMLILTLKNAYSHISKS